MITVRKERSFDKIKKIWEQLYRNNRELSYYQSPEYAQTLWHNIFPYLFILNVIPEFYVFSKEDRTILILPLFKKILKHKYVLFGLKAGVGYLDAIYESTIADEDFATCFKVLGEKIPKAKIQFEHVRIDTNFGKWLVKNGGVLSEEGCTEITLPDRYEDYKSLLSKHMRQNMRTAYNRLNTDGATYSFEYYDYKEIFPKLNQALQNMYVERQISKYGKSKLYRFFVRYVDLGTKIHTAKMIKEKVFVLYINGEVAAYYDAIYAEDTVIVPRLAIAEGFERYSPGIMLINESIKVLISEGVRKLDLTHGTEHYKMAMGGKINNCVRGIIRDGKVWA